jgi:hypothetical protein
MFGGAPAFFPSNISPAAAIWWLAAGGFHLDPGTLFQVISTLGSALAAVNLYRSGSWRQYRVFFAYLIFRVPCIAGALLLEGPSNRYLQFFIYTEPLTMIFYVLVVLELYRLVLARYRGLYTLGRWAMVAAMMVAVVVSAVSLRAAPSHALDFRGFAFVELNLEAHLDLAIVVFILLIICFLGRYPIRLSRNVLVHTVVYSVFFFANSLGLIFWLFHKSIAVTINETLMGIASACAIAWWIGLTPKGEEVEVHLPNLGPDAEERVLERLEALNATLLKASQK